IQSPLSLEKVMASKLLISRLRRQRHVSNSGRRTSRACDMCRERKVKCDGHQPHCSQCIGLGLKNCSYSERKLVRLQNELALDRKKIENYEECFRDLAIEFEGPIAERIQSTLQPEAPEKKFQCLVFVITWLLDDVDIASKDFNRDERSRATGHTGKNSDVVWMQRLDVETKGNG
ncbi:hypothetical protein N7451_012075, partial [Penicillium sp. IBT 35674x]